MGRAGRIAGGDHRGHGVVLLDKVFLADRVVKTLAKGKIAENNAVTDWAVDHVQWK